jgi:hypothetical protein
VEIAAHCHRKDSAKLDEFLERFRLHSNRKPGRWTREQGELYWFEI